MNIKLVNLTKRFVSLRGSIIALDNLNLEIKDSEFFVLLGPSGCGKSTLLNLIAGLERPTNGEIFFDDKSVVSTKRKIFLTPKERNVAMVFQSYALYPHLNVYENIAFPLKISKTNRDEIEESVKRISHLLDILNLLNSKPSELSGGQKQRVAIARALVRKPNIFLLDEPLSNLDAQLRIITRVELKNLQRKLGITTIYVTHDQIEAMTLGDRIAVLKDGKLQQVGVPDELYERPVNKFIATFIGSFPMNLIKAQIIEEEGNFYIVINSRKIKIQDEILSKLKNLKKNVILGIRPEDIKITNKKFQSIEGKIIFIEPLGRELLYHILLDKQGITVVTDEKTLKLGEIVNIEFNLSKIHIFEESNG